MEEEGVVVAAAGEGGEVFASLMGVSTVEEEWTGKGRKATFGACSL